MTHPCSPSCCPPVSEQVEWVTLSHFYSLGFIVRDLLHAEVMGGVVVVAYKILETAQSPNSSFTLSNLTFGLGLLRLGLGLVKTIPSIPLL